MFEFTLFSHKIWIWWNKDEEDRWDFDLGIDQDIEQTNIGLGFVYISVDKLTVLERKELEAS